MIRRRNIHAALAAISLGTFVWLTACVISGSTLPLDNQLRAGIHELAISPLTSAMKLVTVFGSSTWILICTALAVLGLNKDGNRRSAITLALIIGGSYAIENALKYTIQRTRPLAFFDVIQPTTYSFPSGHALLSTALYGALGYLTVLSAKTNLHRAMIWFATALSVVLISCSRVYLGVHYPTDVAGGFLIACFWLNAVLFFAKLP